MHLARTCLLLLCASGLSGLAPAQAQPAGPAAVYRCGNVYSDAPCVGGRPVVVDDTRSDEQRRQAVAVKRQESRLAQQLAQERRARWREASHQGAARIGPSEAQRAEAEDRAVAKQDKRQSRDKKKRSQAGRGRA